MTRNERRHDPRRPTSESRMEVVMKRILLSIAFVLTAVAGAHADTSTYIWQGKGPWSDAQLQAAAQVCDQRYGVIENGAVTSASYKRCMLNQNWKYQSTARVKTYIDPDSGMSCHDQGGGSVCVPPQGTVRYFDPDQGLPCTRTGLVSVCSNFQ
jgi:hypothetical protein